jgi:hypothetical protein
VNVSQVLTVDKRFLAGRGGALPAARPRVVDYGPRQVPGL